MRIVLLSAGVVAFAAGCGSGSGKPSVASLGTSTTTPAGTTTSVQASFEAFAECMTAHGVPTTSPGGHGVQIQGPGPSSRQLTGAQAACRKLLPGGGPPQLSPAQEAERARGLTALAKCMRRHGVSSFPDPNGSGAFPPGSIESLLPGAPDFRAAYKACWSLSPKVGRQIRLAP